MEMEVKLRFSIVKEVESWLETVMLISIKQAPWPNNNFKTNNNFLPCKN